MLNLQVEAFGWGRNSEKQKELSDDLFSVQVKVKDNVDCKKSYGRYRPDVMLCASDSGNDTCSGDSGKLTNRVFSCFSVDSNSNVTRNSSCNRRATNYIRDKHISGHHVLGQRLRPRSKTWSVHTSFSTG